MQVVRPYQTRKVPAGQGTLALPGNPTMPFSPPPSPKPEEFTYHLRQDLDGMPSDRRLLTERPRGGATLAPKEVAKNLHGLTRPKLLGWIGNDEAVVRVEESVLLGTDIRAADGGRVVTSRDTAALKRLADRTIRGVQNRAPMLTAIRDRLSLILGPKVPEDQVRLAVYALLAYEPATFRDAIARAGAETIEAVPSDQPLPPFISFLAPLKQAKKNVYGIVPPGMEGEWEIEFARWLESTDDVIWWHRNEPRKPWAVAVRKEDGRPFYPDFVVRVRGRKEPGIRLIDPHERLYDADGVMKARTRHIAYGRTMMVFRSADDKLFHLVGLGQDQSPAIGAAIESSMLAIED
jgi:hypothetical protein